jgi:hypothetical protein
MPHFAGRHIERAQLLLEMLRIVHQRQQVGERNELAVVQPAADEARVAVTPLLAVGDRVHARPQLRFDRQAHGVVSGAGELRIGKATLEVLMHRLEHPARPRPAAHAHHRESGNHGCGRGVRQSLRDVHGNDRSGHPCHGCRSEDFTLALAQRTLADQERGRRPGCHGRDQLVAGEAAPRGQVLAHRTFGGQNLEQPAARQRIDVLADQQQQSVAAIEIAAVEGDLGLVGMSVHGWRIARVSS